MHARRDVDARKQRNIDIAGEGGGVEEGGWRRREEGGEGGNRIEKEGGE